MAGQHVAENLIRGFGDRWVLSPWPLGSLPIGPRPTAEHLIQVLLGGVAERPLQWNHHWREPDGEIQMSLAISDSGHWLQVPDMCDFLLDLPRSAITVFPTPGLDENTLEHLLVDQVLPRFLAGLGDLVMHASAVDLGGRTALFLGRSGSGKSTLAGLLCAEGAALLSDDCVVLKTSSLGVTAIPTYPSLRLFGDSLAALGHDGTNTTAVTSYTDKRRLQLSPQGTVTPSPIAAIYVLSDPTHAIDEIRIQALPPASACMKLVENAFQLDLADGTHMAGQLAKASAATRAVRTFSLSYPRSYASASGLTQAVMTHLMQASTRGPDADI